MSRTPPTMKTLVDAATLHQRLAMPTPGIVLVDARFSLADPQAGRRAWQAGHLPGAHYADLEGDLSGQITATSGRHPLPPPSALAQTFAGWGIDSERRDQVVVYDAGGGAFAARLWWLLRWLGHDAVAVLDGGFARWQAEGRPVTTAPPPSPAPSRFLAQPDDTRWVTSEALAAALAADDPPLLVDARATPRFAGAEEPIDPVAGHVPGAVNLPFERQLDENGTFLAPAVLADRFRALLGARAPTQLVAMCGSGVTACHLLLGMTHAGLATGRLYAGSWSEWIRDPARPVATGTSAVR